jgi:hypothetical protein
MITTPTALLRELQARALVPAGSAEASAAHAAAPPERPWYIAALLGTSGWVAGFFLLGFVGLLFHPDRAETAALTGAVLLAAAWGLFRCDREGAFVTQLALALSIAGQCLVLYAMNEHARGIGPIAASALLLQVVLALAMPNALHRSLSTLFAVLAWALTVRFVFFGEPEFWRTGRAPEPSLARALAGWLATWLPVGAGVWLLLRREPVWIARGWAPVLRPMLDGAIVGLAFATLASEPFESLRWLVDRGATRPDWLALWPLLSALAALAGVAAGFALRSRALMGASVFAVLLHVSHFYYALGTSLLLKSLLMLAMGAALLLVARSLKPREQRS